MSKFGRPMSHEALLKWFLTEENPGKKGKQDVCNMVFKNEEKRFLSLVKVKALSCIRLTKDFE